MRSNLPIYFSLSIKCSGNCNSIPSKSSSLFLRGFLRFNYLLISNFRSKLSWKLLKWIHWTRKFSIPGERWKCLSKTSWITLKNHWHQSQREMRPIIITRANFSNGPFGQNEGETSFHQSVVTEKIIVTNQSKFGTLVLNLKSNQPLFLQIQTWKRI